MGDWITSMFRCLMLFDYVALGHIHGPQRVGRDTVRYSGTPLKYSFSEANHHKSVTILDIEGKTIAIRTAPLIPKHDMREIGGTFEELTEESFYRTRRQTIIFTSR